ncbi:MULTISPECIES: hypothetical protein [Cyanophyceae]|uniref:hypothetical protein n=1 Tax=Cyanophyceae TaxID=3028117 RepID=UPI00016DC7BB|nr:MULTISPECIES: hypothetical protein [Cyanophyceae]ACA98794.1 conserved hypothetical protein [Picosynechococcus sp. PCC 7002]SMH38716.1 hypothetical protein SAMN06272755_0937 [Picosynechococcus sp. OG1]SMQ78047.1 hypothetical protein SAMN06272774_0216 [Synechococcus sp. 7002]
MDETQWWNKPLIGETSFSEKIVKLISKKSVPEKVVLAHRKYNREIRAKAWHVQRIELNKFDNEDFLTYAKMRVLIEKELGEFKGLKRIIQFLELALTAAESYLLISETELQFRSPLQKSIYKFISQVLATQDHQTVIAILHKKVWPLLDRIKTDKGRIVLQEYLKAIDNVAQYPDGLELLRLFKQATYSYTVLRAISSISKTLTKSDTYDVTQLSLHIRDNQDVFNHLTEILQIPAEHDNPRSYARMLQFIAFKYRYQKNDIEFQELLQRLRDWQLPYLNIVDLRREYSAQDYSLPQAFKEPIPAVDIYEKYQQYL